MKYRLRRNPLRRRLLARKPLRRRLNRLAPRSRIAQPVQFFKRTTYTNAFLTTSTTAPSFKDLEFKLSDVPNFTEFTALYDQYCIKGVKVVFMPRFNVALSNSIDPLNYPVSSQIPQVWSILDYDGANPTTQNAMLQYQNLKITKGTSYHNRYVIPAVVNEVYNSPTTTAYAPKKKVWLDSANTSVPHYGMTVMVPEANTSSSAAWDVKITYYLAFKNVR